MPPPLRLFFIIFLALGLSCCDSAADRAATVEFWAMGQEVEQVKALLPESEEEFKKKRDAFEKKLGDTRSLVQKRRQGLEKATAEAMGTLREAIVKETEKVASAGKIDLVLTKNKVVIGSKDMDLTKSVMDGVNSSLKDIKPKVETN